MWRLLGLGSSHLEEGESGESLYTARVLVVGDVGMLLDGLLLGRLVGVGGDDAPSGDVTHSEWNGTMVWCGRWGVIGSALASANTSALALV